MSSSSKESMNALKAAVKNLVSLEDVATFRNDMNTLLSTRSNELTPHQPVPHSLQLQPPLGQSLLYHHSSQSRLQSSSQVSQPFQRFQPLKPQTIFHVIEQSKANEVGYPFPLPSSTRTSTLSSSYYTPLQQTGMSCGIRARLAGGRLRLGEEGEGRGAEQRKCARTDVRTCASNSNIHDEVEDDEEDEEEESEEEEGEEKDENSGGSRSKRGDEGITWLFEPEEDEVPKGNITLDDFLTGEKEIVYNQDETDEKLIKEIMCANTNMSDVSDEEKEITLDDVLSKVCGDKTCNDYFKLGSP